MLIAVRHRKAATLTTRNAARNSPLPYHLSCLYRSAFNGSHHSQGSDRSASVIAYLASPFRAPAAPCLARSLSACDMLASGSKYRARVQSASEELSVTRAKELAEQLEESVVLWEGPSLTFSPFACRRQESPEPLTSPSTTYTTPARSRRSAGRVKSDPNLKGSASSPISLSSSSPTPLRRPRATPSYTSPLPRTAYTPTKLPLHPFFSSQNVRPSLAPPSPSKPRLAFAYSSSSSSSCSSSHTTSVDQDELANMLAEVSLNGSPRRSASKCKAGVTKRQPAKSKPATQTSVLLRATNPRPSNVSAKGKEKAVSSKTAAMLVAALHTSAETGPLPTFSYSSFEPIGLKEQHLPPTVVYTRCAQEADDLVACLKGDVLGFDLEWPVSGFHRPAGSAPNAKRVAVGGVWQPSKTPGGKGTYKFSEQRTALVQVCDEKMIILIHLMDMEELPARIKELISDRSIYKTGVQVAGDGKKLVRDFKFEANAHPKGLLELSWIARKVDPLVTGPGSMLISLANLSKMYLRHELDKGAVRISDWSKELSKAQREYAANDVYASLQIYLHLKRLAAEREIDIDHDAHSTHLGTHKVVRPKSPSGDEKITILRDGPPRTQGQAFDLFMDGVECKDIAASLGIKENTVHNYVLNVARDFATEEFNLDAQRRMLKALPASSYCRRSHAGFISKMERALSLVSRSPSPSSATE